ncbi:hypothetical protein F2P45_13825 [Massilia sp. CCM 8733]|uniref:Uncharacterized protein n=1 Tax=Massilia mucilaginosa TaxID=2609282 RepID=A0ABX0NTJ1_9BURK|nr:hypothetical protein [Massilia mucilaginosa]NHZ90086.1 hypothetical protein [Massilia mucilaginosa]
MSARDFFVVDEERDAHAREAYAPWKAAAGNEAAEPSAAQGKGLTCADQFGKEHTMLQFLVKHISPFLIIALLVTVVVATGDSASLSDIPAPCRG